MSRRPSKQQRIAARVAAQRAAAQQELRDQAAAMGCSDGELEWLAPTVDVLPLGVVAKHCGHLLGIVTDPNNDGHLEWEPFGCSGIVGFFIRLDSQKTIVTRCTETVHKDHNDVEISTAYLRARWIDAPVNNHQRTVRV